MSGGTIDKVKLKGLQTQIAKLEAEISLDRTQISNTQKQMSTKINNLKSLKIELSKLTKSSDVIVSEHAILRYLERVKGVDIEELKNEILTDDIRKMSSTLGGNGKYPEKEFRVVMKNNVIITIET